tara:strand:- start:1227 stop:1457 length:231 start_codon:yes stop_codon:yes gene_type:complete
MKNLENRLRLFIDWLEDADFYKDSYRDGQLETMIKSAQEETCRKVADYLREVLDMSDASVEECLEKSEIIDIDDEK